MSTSFTQYRHRAGILLVALQFALLAWLAALAMPALLQGHLPVAAGLLLALSMALAGWTLAHNRLGNFNIHPAPKADGMLVTGGPYRLIRHPMYSAVLLAGAALVWLADPWLAWSAWGALAGVLWAKARLEEHWLSQHHALYAGYCKNSKRFIPWVL